MKAASVVRHKYLSFDSHSGLDPESSLSELDSRFRGNDGFGINVKKRWTHYTSRGAAVSLQVPGQRYLRFQVVHLFMRGFHGI